LANLPLTGGGNSRLERVLTSPPERRSGQPAWIYLAEQGVNDYALFAICFSHNRDSRDLDFGGE